MKIGIYGGSFDPIHHGHLVLAREACEQLALDQVVFIPAVISPHKLTTEPTPGATRRAMVLAAISDEPKFAFDDCDLHRGTPSFAIDTVTDFRARWPGADLHYLVGHDNIAKLHTWHRFEELNQMVRFVVLGRASGETPHGYPMVARRIDISATDIRARVARGVSIRYLVPESVREIIEHRQLYKEPSHRI